MAQFAKAYEEVIENEGIYSNDPIDFGGRTVFGVSENNWPKWDGWAVLDKLKSIEEIEASQKLKDMVQLFYFNNFWNPIKGDDIESQVIANSIFDFAVNSGVKTSVKLAQQVVGVADDGVIGNDTLAALDSADERLFIAEFKLKKIERYCDIVDKKPDQLRFLKGWTRRSLK